MEWLVFIVYFDRLDMRLVCYYANWSVYRYTDVPSLYPDAIDPSLCTHIHVAFAVINPITLQIEASEQHDTHFTDVFSTVELVFPFFYLFLNQESIDR
jgi:GH18 family chitinase